MIEHMNGSDLHFIFVVDRSASMRRRIEVTQDALKIFIRSLPVDCHFTITSFGTKHDNMLI